MDLNQITGVQTRPIRLVYEPVKPKKCKKRPYERILELLSHEAFSQDHGNRRENRRARTSLSQGALKKILKANPDQLENEQIANRIADIGIKFFDEPGPGELVWRASRVSRRISIAYANRLVDRLLAPDTPRNEGMFLGALLGSLTQQDPAVRRMVKSNAIKLAEKWPRAPLLGTFASEQAHLQARLRLLGVLGRHPERAPQEATPS